MDHPVLEQGTPRFPGQSQAVGLSHEHLTAQPMLMSLII